MWVGEANGGIGSLADGDGGTTRSMVWEGEEDGGTLLDLLLCRAGEEDGGDDGARQRSGEGATLQVVGTA